MKTTLPRLAHWKRALFVGRHASIYFRFHFYGLIIWRVFFSCFFFGKCVTFHIWCLSIKHLLFIDLSPNSNFASKNHEKKIHRLVDMIQFLMCGGGVFIRMKSNYGMTQYNCLLVRNAFVFRFHFFISILFFFTNWNNFRYFFKSPNSDFKWINNEEKAEHSRATHRLFKTQP